MNGTLRRLRSGASEYLPASEKRLCDWNDSMHISFNCGVVNPPRGSQGSLWHDSMEVKQVIITLVHTETRIEGPENDISLYLGCNLLW